MNEPITLLHSSSNNEKLKHYRKTLSLKENSVKTLSRMFMMRSNRHYIYSLIIAIPTLIVTVFLFNYININIKEIRKEPTYDILINKTVFEENEERYFTEQEIEFFKNLEEINYINFKNRVDVSQYVMEMNNEKTDNLSSIIINNKRYLFTGIQPFSAVEVMYGDTAIGNIEDINKENHIILNKNLDSIGYKVGDKFYLYKYNNEPKDNIEHNHDSSSDYVHSIEETLSNPIELTVAALIDKEGKSRLVQIYLNDIDYNTFVGTTESDRIEVTLKDGVDYIEFASMLKKEFPDEIRYHIVNQRYDYDISMKQSIGLFYLIEIILFIIFFFVLIILYAFLQEYIIGQGDNIRTIYILGASKQDIFSIYIRQSFTASIFCFITSCSIGIFLSKWFFSNTGYHIPLNRFAIFTYISIFIVVIIAFNLPVHLELKRKFRNL